MEIKTIHPDEDIPKNLPPFRLGLDYVFEEGTQRPVCIEINGDYSGDGKLRKINETAAAGYYKFSGPQNLALQSPAIQDLIESKADHNQFIPEENRAEVKKIIGIFQRLGMQEFKEEDYLVLKSAVSNRGKDVLIGLTPEIAEQINIIRLKTAKSILFREAHLAALAFFLTSGNSFSKLTTFALAVLAIYEVYQSARGNSLWSRLKQSEKIIVQEFIKPSAADNAPQMGPACLRHLLIGKYNPQTEEAFIQYESFCQRAQPEAKSHDYIVNASRGAKPIEASQREKDSVSDISRRITQNLLKTAFPQQVRSNQSSDLYKVN